MGKRSRRGRRRRAARAAASSETEATRRQGKKDEGTGLATTGTIDFGEQYSYVYDDLKRIAILAGAMFAVLIALSFVIG